MVEYRAPVGYTEKARTRVPQYAAEAPRRVRFEWDPEKAASNLAKHGVAFEEASTVFGDRLATSVLDPDHSDAEEERWLTTGFSAQGRIVAVWHTDRGDIVRIIGARRATPNERRTYESGE